MESRGTGVGVLEVSSAILTECYFSISRSLSNHLAKKAQIIEKKIMLPSCIKNNC